ncbi:MAG TPA: DUF2958 domain-containing protein [Thermoleophilia bacterium]
MKLRTKTLEKQLPQLRSQEPVDDPMVRAHFFDPTGPANWYITEGSPEGDDFVMFGLCDMGLGFPELGYASMNELQSVKTRLGLGVERDLYWTPKPLSEIKRSDACTCPYPGMDGAS